tara:strand:- start:656 stop:2311 length:1656 start_codon:yes stop_codon:yes gene_type:complete
MSAGDTDFDVKNYGIEELIAIMDASHDVPLSKSDIIDITQKYIDKYDDKPKFKKFFFDVRKKLLSEKSKAINDSIFGPDETERSITEKIVGDRYKTSSELLDERKKVQAELKFPSVISKPASFIQGRLNPTYIDKIVRVINFDSKDRTILDPMAVNCRVDGSGNPVFDSGNSNDRLDSASNYTVNLNEILTNVVEITLDTAEIPHAWYVFNASYGTNYFVTQHDAKPCMIDEGNYTSGQDIVNALNEAANNTDISRNLLFYYHARQNRISVKNTGTELITIKWYSPMAELALCVEGGAVGQKLDYNLGWLLGFRSPEYPILPDVRIVSEAQLDLHGPRYLIISLDDFCNNKPNQSLIANKSNKANFKLPSYYNKYTMDPGCEVPYNNTRRRGCRTRAINMDLSSNLTNKQKYTVDQLKLAMTGKPADRYDSPTPSDLLHRIPIVRNIAAPFNVSTTFKNLSPDLKRIYYGPVNLNKFSIKLLDDRGLLMNLNGVDWSFSIKVTQLKSYGAMTQDTYSKSQAALTYNAVKAAMDGRILTDEEKAEREEKLGF